MDAPVYSLRYCGVRQEGLFAWSVGGLRAFTLGQEVQTSNYTEVVRALGSGQFELVNTMVPGQEEPVPDDTETEGDETPPPVAPIVKKGPSTPTSLKNRNK